MKKLIIIVFALTVISCGNKKHEIVELIKTCKDSAKLVQKEMLQVSIDDTKMYEEMFWTNGKVDFNKVKDSKIQKEYYDYQTEVEIRRWELNFKKAKYDNLIDSLELELKKY